jgi:hypothetical protein
VQRGLLIDQESHGHRVKLLERVQGLEIPG